ncbi:RNA-binding protein [Anaerosporomusa subterranea]|uniref:RNA-binding protein n=1 Tax=Anaerosporomusa subterranea TaxID=1794912 RepID=A0A154BN29_ANASB|nr:S1-like domain-containing RNA-binding protein [Anaerosporomusa subterranea]KYZ75374.1 RNA-binding protein [Anaerosporomusa subterranea]
MDPEKKLQAGNVVTLRAVRSSELGVFLDAGTGKTSEDILLHKAQQTREIAIGDEVAVYLYLDPKDRLTASMNLPKMQEGQIARVKVINTTRDGAFVDIGAERGVFLPFAEMRGSVKTGETIWAKLYRDKSGRMAVSMDVDAEMQRVAKPAEGVKVGDEVTASIYNMSEFGAFLLTKERWLAFLHNDEMTSRPKVGEELTVRVTFVREDGRINVSMRPVKENAMDLDSAKLLDAMAARGRMPYTDETSPEIIKAKFGISKAAFKRALGRLMKEGKVEQKDGWTQLCNQESQQ